MANKVQVDLPPVDQGNAASFVVHHLALAMGYFQALPEGGEREVMEAQIREQFQGFTLEQEVASIFSDALCSQYERLAAEDEAMFELALEDDEAMIEQALKALDEIDGKP